MRPRNLVLLSLLALVCALPLIADGPESGDAPIALDARDWMNTADGEPIAVEDLAGKIVVIEFWGTWCPPCRAVIPHMKEIYEQYAATGKLVIIGVHSVKGGNTQAVHDFVTENEMPYTVCIDNGRAAIDYGITGYPTAFIFGPEQTLLYRGHPAAPDFEAIIDNQMVELLTNMGQ